MYLRSRALKVEGARLLIYDPEVSEKDILSCVPGVLVRYHSFTLLIPKVAESPYVACRDAHAIVCLTDWEEFKDIDYSIMYSTMRRPAYFFGMLKVPLLLLSNNGRAELLRS